jgi:hypothetical protein
MQNLPQKITVWYFWTNQNSISKEQGQKHRIGIMFIDETLLSYKVSVLYKPGICSSDKLQKHPWL